MLWTAGSLSIVVGVYLGALYWDRAAEANRNALAWGAGALVVFDLIIGAALLATYLLGSALSLPYFIQVWIAIVLWFIVTLVAGIKTDSVFERKLPISAAT